MPLTMNCSWEEFKHRAKEFHQAAPTLDYNGLDNAFKALGLSYLGMCEDMWRHSASIVLKMATKTYIERELELNNEHAN